MDTSSDQYNQLLTDNGFLIPEILDIVCDHCGIDKKEWIDDPLSKQELSRIKKHIESFAKEREAALPGTKLVIPPVCPVCFKRHCEEYFQSKET